MSKKGGGSQTTQTVQTADPWVGVQPYLSQLYGSASANYTSGPRGYYPGQLSAGMNPNLQGAMGQIYSKGMNDTSMNPAIAGNNAYASGSAVGSNPWLTGKIQQQDKYASGSQIGTNPFASGSYLSPDNNPWLRNMVEAASRPITENFQNAIAPSLASQFSAAGRTGSGAHVAAFDQAASTLGRQLGDTSAGLYGQAYQQGMGLMSQANEAERQRAYGAYETGNQQRYDAFNTERNRQLQAIGMAPALTQASYYGGNQALGVGQSLYNMDQGNIDRERDRYNYNVQEPSQRLAAYSQLLAGAAPYASQNGTTTQNLPKPSPFMSLAGGGLMGGALGSMFGFGLPGAAIGAGLGLFGM